MKIYLGSDHAGFYLKEKIFAHLVRAGYDVEDEGDKVLDPADDYPQFAYTVTTKILGSEDDDARGILLCGGGQGMCIAANRVRGIRAVVVWDEHEAKMARNDNDSNVLCLPARSLEDKQLIDIVDVWLKTPFSKAARHARRIREIEDIYG
ncbi:MAG TPA: RpiB/LacA/LacB family sugar-phosphate isomerase [Patescibacteria group bacterium]|jgi:ribose 5-phosphate isomerase B|nr:RpiB/LacA/LacB family sugar-phosphate isomerase [Patescibacteria group bacterium]